MTGRGEMGNIVKPEPDDSSPKMGVAVTVILLSLAGGAAIALSPAATRNVLLAGLATIMLGAAGLRSAAECVRCWRCGKRLLGLMSAVLCGLLLLLMLVTGQRFVDLIG